MTNFTDLLKGISGTFEINRVVGAAGGAAYIICANLYVAWNLAHGHEFNVTEYCLAFPSGLGVVVGSIAGAVALKDRNVATASVVQNTGSQPGQAASGAAETGA